MEQTYGLTGFPYLIDSIYACCWSLGCQSKIFNLGR